MSALDLIVWDLWFIDCGKNNSLRGARKRLDNPQPVGTLLAGQTSCKGKFRGR